MGDTEGESGSKQDADLEKKGQYPLIKVSIFISLLNHTISFNPILTLIFPTWSSFVLKMTDIPEETKPEIIELITSAIERYITDMQVIRHTTNNYTDIYAEIPYNYLN